MIHGIDVARYEPNIKWNQVKDAGYRFAFIKASQATFPDPKFTTHWKGAREVGLPRGAYHFYDPSVSPELQALYFWNIIKEDMGELPFIVDIERFTSGPYFGSENWYKYINKLNTLSNNHPLMIYTGYYYWKDYSYKYPSVKDISYFASYPLWIANYGSASPLVPTPWSKWTFWQYSETGLVPGIYDDLGRPTECDLNKFNGGEDEFAKLIGIPFPPTGEPKPVSIFYVAVGNITIRTGPGLAYSQVTDGEKYVLTGDIVETDQPLQDGFAKIKAIYRSNVKMVTAVNAWCGSGYLRPTVYTPPTTETPPASTVKHVIEVDDKGNLTIDGKPYV